MEIMTNSESKRETNFIKDEDMKSYNEMVLEVLKYIPKLEEIKL